jgi:hypothetical protein
MREITTIAILSLLVSNSLVTLKQMKISLNLRENAEYVLDRKDHL